MGLLKPAWQNKNIEKAVKAIEKIKDPAILAEIARSDCDSVVRALAVFELRDEALLTALAKEMDDVVVERQKLTEKFTPFLKESSRKGTTLNEILVGKIHSRSFLEDIAKQAKKDVTRVYAIRRLGSCPVVHDIAKNDSDEGIRCCAVQVITNRALLEDIARNDSSKWVRSEAKRRHEMKNIYPY